MELQDGSEIVCNSKKYIVKVKNGRPSFEEKPKITITITKESGLEKHSFLKSTIIECKINNTVFSKLKYASIIDHIYKIIDDGARIIKCSNLETKTRKNFKTIETTENGWRWLDDIGISVRNMEANLTLSEIFHQCIENNIKLQLTILLEDGVFVKIEI